MKELVANVAFLALCGMMFFAYCVLCPPGSF